MKLTLQKLYLPLSSGGSANYDVVDGGMCSWGDMGNVKALTHVLDLSGVSEDGIVVVL